MWPAHVSPCCFTVPTPGLPCCPACYSLQLLRRAMEDDSASDSGTGWKALAELQYENRHYPQAYETGAVRGAVWWVSSSWGAMLRHCSVQG